MFECVAGPDLGPALAGCRVCAGLDGEALVEALAASQRLVSWAQARQAELVAEVARRVPEAVGAAGCAGYEVAEFEVGAALRLSSRAAQARVDGCLAIAERPAVLEALRAGRLDWVRAEAVASAVGELASRPGMAQAADQVEAAGAGAGPGPDRAAGPRRAGPPGPEGRPGRRRRPAGRGPQGAAGVGRPAGGRDGRAAGAAGRAGRPARVRRAGGGGLGGALRRARRPPAGRARGRRERGEPALDAGPLPTLDQCRADALVELLLRDGAAVGSAVGRTGGGSRRGWGGFSPRRGPPPAAPTEASASGPVPRGSARRSWSPSPPGRCSAWAGSPPTSPGTGRSPTPGPRARPGRRVAAGAHRPRDGRGPRRRPRPARPARRPRAVRPGQRRHVPVPRLPRQAAGCDLDHTVPLPRGRDVRRRTCTPCAAATTASNTRPAGRSPPGPAAGWSGPAPSEPSTPPPARPRRRGLHANVRPPTRRTRAQPDVREPDPGWPWEDFDDDLHRWLADPAAGPGARRVGGWAELQPAGRPGVRFSDRLSVRCRHQPAHESQPRPPGGPHVRRDEPHRCRTGQGSRL